MLDNINLQDTNMLANIKNLYNALGDVLQYDCTLKTVQDASQITPREECNPMAYKRIHVLIGSDASGKPIYTQIGGNTQDERNDNIVRAYIESGRIWEFLPMAQPIAPVPVKTQHNFKDYVWTWYNVYKKDGISTKYKATLQARIKRLCKTFGEMTIEDITIEDVQRFLTSLSDMTTETIGKYRNALSQILESAIEDGIIEKNPTKSKRLCVKGTDGEGNKAISVSECQRLNELLPTLPGSEAMCIAVMLYAGLRREEMLGLQWGDIDFDKHILHVKRAIVFGNDGKAEVKPPKNKSSERNVPMSDFLESLLRPHRKESGFVITNAKGNLFIDRQYKTFWNRVRECIDMPDLDARELRHTYATMNAAADVDMKTIGIWMGHSKIATTAEIYTQGEPLHMQNVRNRMSEYVRNTSA